MSSNFHYRVRLHFVSLSLTRVPFEQIMSATQRVYGQYGIKAEYVSGESLRLSPEEARRFATVDGACEWKVTSGEFREIQDLGRSVPSGDITVYFVNQFARSTSRGCGGHMPGRHACIVAANGTQWTTPHEIGHVMLTSAFPEVHSTDRGNLMFSDTGRINATLPTLTPAQIGKIKQSPCCVRT